MTVCVCVFGVVDGDWVVCCRLWQVPRAILWPPTTKCVRCARGVRLHVVIVLQLLLLGAAQPPPSCRIHVLPLLQE